MGRRYLAKIVFFWWFLFVTTGSNQQFVKLGDFADKASCDAAQRIIETRFKGDPIVIACTQDGRK